MAQRQMVLLVAVFAAGVLVSDVPTYAATLGYVVNPEGLLLTLDTDTDTVIGIRQISGLAPDERHVRRRPQAQTGQALPMPGAEPGPGEGMATTGRSLVTPDGDRMLVLDPLPYGLPRGFLVDEEPSGRIFVYDVMTGARLGHIGFSVRGADRLVVVHPRGDKAYVVSEGLRSDQMVITVVSLTAFTVVKELFVPRGDFLLGQSAP
jgi:hypothetical protein